MKKLVCCLLALFLFAFVLPQPTKAATSYPTVALVMDGTPVKLEVPPQIINDRTMVPVKFVSENIGAKVYWDGVKRKVTVIKDSTNIQLTLGAKTVYVNYKPVVLDVAPLVVSDRTFVPVKYIGEWLKYDVKWVNETRTVMLSRQVAAQPPAPVATPTPSATPKPTSTPAATPSPTPTRTPWPSPTATPSPTVAPTPTPTPTPAYPELQSVQMVGNVLTVKAAKPVAAKVVYVANPDPDRLVVDIPRVTFSAQLPKPAPGQTGEIAVANHPFVSKIRYSYFDPATSTIRIVVDLKTRASYKVLQNGSTGTVAVELAQDKFKVVIDPGHGYQDNGATSIMGRYEKNFNLSLGKKVYNLLLNEPEIHPYLTRSTDVFVTLDGRVEFANNLDADLFISIHGNAFPNNPSVNGVETFYWNSYSKALAEVMHKQLLSSTGFADRSVRVSDFRVITYTKMPAVLLEVGYLSNKYNEAAMFQDAFQNRVAASIVTGIKQYLNIN